MCAARAIGALAGAAIGTLALLCSLILDLSDQQTGRFRAVGPFEIEVDLPQLPSGFVGAPAALFVQGFARLGVEGVVEGVISHDPFGRKAVAQAHLANGLLVIERNEEAAVTVRKQQPFIEPFREDRA